MILLALATSAATPLAASPAETTSFHRLMDDYWATGLRESPVTASFAGVTTYDDQLDEVGTAAMDRQAGEASAFLARLNAIPAAGLDPADVTNRSILKRQLESAIEGNRFGQRQLLYSTLGSYHNAIAGLAEQLPFRTRADYDHYLSRMALVPDRMRAYTALSVAVAKQGFVQPCVTMTGFEGTITGVIAADPAKSRFYLPFAGARPASISAADWATMQARARDLIATRINPSYQGFDDAYVRDIKGKCRTSVGISALPGGQAYYACQVRVQTTTDLTPDAIHRLGVSEVARIRAEMVEVATKAGFASREAMIAEMRTNPKISPTRRPS